MNYLNPKIISVILVIIYYCSGCTPACMKLNESGYKKAIAKDYHGAFVYFDLAIKLNDKFWDAYTNRGICYYMQNNYEKAMDDFNTSISLHPKNFSAYDNRGLCRKYFGDTAGAIIDFKEALKYNRKDSMIY